MQLLHPEGFKQRHDFPPLEGLLSSLPQLGMANKKVEATMEIVRHVAESLRSCNSVPFYSMREFQRLLGVSLRTVATAFERLEAEGLLVRLRGAHTRLTGTQLQPRAPIRGVVGWLENMYTLRYYDWKRAFSRAVGDAIRRSHHVTDTILYWNGEELQLDFADRILVRKPDVVVWFQPLGLYRQTFDILREKGIRSLIVCDKEIGQVNGQILVDWSVAYERIPEEWTERYNVKQVLIVDNPKPSYRLRGQFEMLAKQRGMVVKRVPYVPDLPRFCARDISTGQGVVFIDEWSAAEFGRSPHFLETSRRHRILFARDLPCIVSAPPEEYDVDVLCYPVAKLVEGLKEILLYSQAGANSCVTVQGMARLGNGSFHH